MRQLNYICYIILIITVAIMAIHRFFYAFPDIVIRIDGVTMMIAIVIFFFTRGRNARQKIVDDLLDEGPGNEDVNE